ncbi:MAG: TetR/AcrR family transcriptional regulator [Streptosporangiales bacterium]
MSESASTRQRIQQVALDLFGEQGYDKTSLREIAERLDVTKAALYYHFKSKEDILQSVLEDYLSEVEALLDWAEAAPADASARTEFVRSYAGIVERRFKSVRFVQQAPTQMRESGIGRRFRDVMRRVNTLVRPPDAPLVDQVRALAAVLSIHVGTVAFGSGARMLDGNPFGDAGQHDPEDVRAAVTQVAEELITAANRPDG